MGSAARELTRREQTKAGDRSILELIYRTIQHGVTEFDQAPSSVAISRSDAHLLAKELYDRRLTNGFESRDEIEARIRDGRLTLFGTNTPIRVAS